MIARLSKRMASFFARNNVIKSESAGGFHAKTHLGCCCILAIVLSLFITFVKFVPNEVYGIVSAIAVAFSVVIILMFAPLEHENKPISYKDKSRLALNSTLVVMQCSQIPMVMA